MLDVDLTVRVDPPLSRPLSLKLEGLPAEGMDNIAGGRLGEGRSELPIRATLLTAGPETTCTLVVDGLLRFHHGPGV